MHAASKSFEEKLAAAAQNHYHNSRASVAPVSTRGAVGGVSQHLLPPFDFGPSSRSSSVNSAAGTWHPEDHETVGSLLGSLLPVQHTAMPRPFGGTGSAPTSATTTPRGDAVYHATPHYPPSSYQPSSMVGVLPPSNTAATTYDLDVAVADQAQRRFAQDAMRLAQLEAEEAQIAAEERALKMELQEVDARRRTIDAALFAMHREWREFGENQRDLRLEPVLDLSADIAHAEGCVEAVRRRVVDAHHKYDMLQAQLAVVDQVDAHKAAQLATLTELDQRFKELNARRSAAVSWIKAQAWIDNTRAQLTNQAKMQLEAVEHLAALDRAQMPQFQQQQQPPTLPARTPLALTNGVVPALKGSRAVVQQQQAPIASSRAASQRSVSRAVDDASRPANADAASQARRGASCSSARSGVSFAIQLDDESDDVASHDEDDDVQLAPPAFHPDDISGGMSFAFPTVANVLGMKRNRSEVHAS